MRPSAGWSLLLVAIGGCMLTDAESVGRTESTSLLAAPAGSDVVIMDIAVVEGPPGDLYLNRDLWTNLDEQVGGVERKALWEQNGFRVGQVGGIPPGRLQAMLTSERSCPDPHRARLRAGNAKVVPLGQVRGRCEFDLSDGGSSEPLTLDQAQCQMAVTPRVTADGRVTLTLSPRVKHAGPPRYPQPDAGDWPLGARQSVENFPGLACDVTLSPRDYLVVGTWIDRPRSFGYQALVNPDPQRPGQRVLVIRARPAGEINEFSAPFVADVPGETGVKPPALQATAGQR